MLTISHSRVAPLLAAAATVAAAMGVLAPPAQPAKAQSPSVSCEPGEVAVRVAGIRACVAYVNGVVLEEDQAQQVELRSTSGGSTVTQCVRPWGDDTNPGAVGPRTVPCYYPGKGWYSRQWDCHFQPAEEAIDPSPAIPGYDHENPPGGGVYDASCYPPGSNQFEIGPHWIPAEPPLWATSSQVILPGPPDGYMQAEDSRVAELWVEAVNELQLHGPHIHTAPPLSTAGIVGLRTWLWTPTDSPHIWAQRHATADARPDGLNEWVDITAEPSHITWHMGDPDDPVPVHCDHPGEAFEFGMGHLRPDCGYTYQRPSRHEPDSVFHITATTTWHLQWSVNGQPDGQAELDVATTAPYQVQEIQVLVKRSS